MCTVCQSRPWAARTQVPRQELPSLAIIHDADQRLFLRMYLRSNIEKDQDVARQRCQEWGIDYETARQEARTIEAKAG
jgi:hypothetical protein